MSDQVGNPEDLFSHNEAHLISVLPELEAKGLIDIEVCCENYLHIVQYYGFCWLLLPE